MLFTKMQMLRIFLLKMIQMGTMTVTMKTAFKTKIQPR